MEQNEDDFQALVAAAARMGLSLDEAETATWLAAIAASIDSDDVVVDTRSGAFGHRVSMLDFSPKELDRFRRIGEVVEVAGEDGVAESALALSGSAAQSKIQSYPGDADFFQRLNIIAPTRDAACGHMARLLRAKVLAFERGDTFQFIEAILGSYPVETVRGKAGSPISWTIAEVRAGELATTTADGETVTLKWDEVALDPGWVKLDWVVIDPARRSLSNASNVIDVTWEAPDGTITPLDGYLDAFFQEVYLDAGDVPMFAKIARFVSDDSLDDYVEALEKEVKKYLTKDLNYGKAAKRMYNVFRLSGRYIDAAFVRELFDHPTTILYRVHALVGTLDDATRPDSAIPIESVITQADQLVQEVVDTLDGPAESQIVAALLALRASLDEQSAGEERTAAVMGAQTQLINEINTFFRDKLVSVPTIKDYIDSVQEAKAR